MKKYPKYTIIIPLYKKTNYFFEAVEKCLELDYPNFEIIIGVDRRMKVNFADKKIRVLRTGLRRTGPAEKRDIGIRNAKGEYIAFLDDDSYPERDWLRKSLQILKKQKVSAVCGPGLTPIADSFSQKITGAVLASFLGSGPYAYRFIKRPARFVDDYPAYNLVVSKKVLDKIGGFGTKYYGGEDTALCIKIINSGEKIYYHPDIVVYHHRRAFPFEYAKQVGNVGKHRGYFVKAYPQTSLRLSYFGPAIATLLLPIILLVAIFNSKLSFSLIALSLVYYISVFTYSLRDNNVLISLFLPISIALNHLFYGVNFIKGLVFTDKLIR